MKDMLTRTIADDISDDLKKFPSLGSYMKNLYELTTPELKIKSYKEIGELFYKKAILFQQTFGINPKGEFNKQKFYRVRMNISEGEDPNLIRTHSYPSPCTTFGRANLIGKSIFYCSNHPGSSISESRGTKDKIGYLSVWEPRAERDVKYGICLPQDLRRENEFNFMSNNTYNFITEDSKQDAGEKAAHLQFYHRFIAERFVKETHPYTLTSWIANEMLYGPQWRDFIIYPSVANESYSCNMAFHPNSADTLLKFKKVLEFKVGNASGHDIQMKETKIGEIEHSKMKWRKALPRELTKMMPGGRYFL